MPHYGLDPDDAGYGIFDKLSHSTPRMQPRKPLLVVIGELLLLLGIIVWAARGFH